MLELLRKRRSIRKFRKEPLPEEALAALKEAVLRSPSSRGLNPWTFFFVQDPEVLGKLSCAKEHGAGFLKNAPLAVVVCGDDAVSDVWIEDCSIAALVVHLTAESLGLGGCWIQIRNRRHDAGTTSEDYVQDVLGIGRTLRVLAMVAVGIPDEAKAGHPFGSLDQGKIIG